MRHEKIVLVLLAYIIGFTTAYIGFGLTPESDRTVVRYTFSDSTAEAISTDVQSPSMRRGYDVDVFFKDNGMFARIDGQVVVISGKLRPDVEPGPGFHVAIPSHAVSPDGNYIYYCEQQTAESEQCRDYVYIVGAHQSKPLRFNGASLTSSIIQSEFSWQEDGTVQYNGYHSRSADEPWRLTN